MWASKDVKLIEFDIFLVSQWIAVSEVKVYVCFELFTVTILS